MNNDHREVYEQVVKESVKELSGIMEVPLDQRLKDIAKRMLGRSVRTKDPMFWPAGLLMLGLVTTADNHPELKELSLNAVSKHTDMWLKDYNGSIDFVDDALAGFCFVKAYEMTGDDKYKDAANKIAEFIVKSPRDNDGSVIYNPGRNSSNIFADGVGQVSMFMAAYEKAFGGCDLYVSAGDKLSASKQLKNFYAHGIDKRTGLNYHGYSMEEGVRKGLLGWGRAFGWLFLGVTETALLAAGFNSDVAASLGAGDNEGDAASMSAGSGADYTVKLTSSENVKKDMSGFDAIRHYRELCEIALEHQREDGGWSWQIQAVEGHIDMSATGMIAYCLARGAKAGLLCSEMSCDAKISAGNECKETATEGDLSRKVEIALAKAADCMCVYSRNGVVTQALSSCDDFGVHYQTYGSYPWGQGAVLAALSLL